MKAERVRPCAAASSSIACSVPTSIETLAFADWPVSRTTGTMSRAAPPASARRPLVRSSADEMIKAVEPYDPHQD